MATVPLPPCDGPRLQTGLYEKFRIEVPVMEWQGRQHLRVSIGAYTMRQDIERLTRALRALLRS
jgi:selenocysteine lyase/cysteine desulfurase